MIVYVDLDGTLIYAEEDPRTGLISNIDVRPGASTFLFRLAQLGDVVLLTFSERPHAEAALQAIGRASEVFKKVITREDLEPVIEGFLKVDEQEGLTLNQRKKRYMAIPPIQPPGFMIDDYPVGSWLYWVKSRAIDIDPDMWIHVPVFEPRRSKGDALTQAYGELLRRMASAQEAG